MGKAIKKGTKMDTRTRGIGHVHVLIVEDHPGELRTLTDLLNAEEFAVTGCPTAREALTHLQEETFSLAVVDLHLPDQTGTDLLEHVRTKHEQGLTVMLFAPCDGGSRGITTFRM